MPNIEIYGYNSAVSKVLRKQIFEELFVDKPYVKEMVVTIIPSKVADTKGWEQPFIRLLSSNSEEAEEILEIVEEKLPGIDIEYVKIEKFIPKK